MYPAMILVFLTKMHALRTVLNESALSIFVRTLSSVSKRTVHRDFAFEACTDATQIAGAVPRPARPAHLRRPVSRVLCVCAEKNSSSVKRAPFLRSL